MQEMIVVSEEQRKIIDDIDHAMDILWATDHVLWSSDLAPNGVHTLNKGARTYMTSLEGSNTIIFCINNFLYKIRDAKSFVKKVLAKEDVTNDLNDAMFATYDDQAKLMKLIRK